MLRQHANRDILRWARTAGLLSAMMLLVAAMSLVSLWFAYDAAGQAFQRQGDRLAHLLSRRLSDAGAALSSAAVMHADGEARRRAGYARLLRFHPQADALLWLDAVAPAERAAYEARTRRAGSADFRIRARDTGGAWIAAPRRPGYLPIATIVAKGAAEHRLAPLRGLDAGGDAALQAAIVRAIESGAMSASAPIRLPDGKAGYFVVLADYGDGPLADSPATRAASLRGLHALYVDVERLVAGGGLDAARTRYALSLRRADGGAESVWLIAQAGEPAQGVLARLLPIFHTEIDLEAPGQSLRLSLRQPVTLTRDAWLPIGVLLLLGFAAGAMTWRDLRHRRAWLRAHERGERQLRQIVDLVPAMIMVTNREGRVLLLNRAAAEAHASTVETMTGAPLAEGPFGFAGRRFADRTIIAAAQTVSDDDEPMRHAKWGMRTMRTVRMPLEAGDAGADPRAALLTVAVDISDERRTQQALRENEQRLTDYVNIASDWFWASDAEHRFSYISDRLYTVTGVGPREIIGKRRDDIARIQTGDSAWSSHLEDLAACRPFRDFRYQFVCPDGRLLWVSISGMPVFDEAGSFRGYRGTGTDITAEMAQHLALTEAKEQAESASRAKTEFLANMSHELRTPLNAIIGFSDLTMNQAFGPIGNAKYREYARDIHDSGRHLLAVINDILDLSKVEAGRLDLIEEEFEIGALVEKCIALMREPAQARGLELRTALPADLPLVLADERKLKQILLNLLSNAVKFTEPEGAVVLEAGIGADGDLKIGVRDTGIGMNANELARAFEPFRQIDSALNRRYEGTGLGLPLSRGLARLHNGDLRLISEPGQGTEATLILPAARLSYRRAMAG